LGQKKAASTKPHQGGKREKGTLGKKGEYLGHPPRPLGKKKKKKGKERRVFVRIQETQEKREGSIQEEERGAQTRKDRKKLGS